MNFLSKLNPLNWLKTLLLSRYVGGQVRTWLAMLGGYLIAQHAAPAPVVNGLVDYLTQLLTDPTFQGWIIATIAGVASIAEKIIHPAPTAPVIVQAGPIKVK